MLGYTKRQIIAIVISLKLIGLYLEYDEKQNQCITNFTQLKYFTMEHLKYLCLKKKVFV